MTIAEVAFGILALGLCAAIAAVFVSARLLSQLKETQARLVNEIAARGQVERQLEGHETVRARAEETAKALDARVSDLEAARAEIPPLQREMERLTDALTRSKEAEASALAIAQKLEAKVEALVKDGEERERELQLVRESRARAQAEAKAAEVELRRTGTALAALETEATALGERAARFEKQLFETLAGSKLEKQLLETLGASQEHVAQFGKALQKAESDVWKEKTAKEASLLEVRALRDDLKRVQSKLAEEMARREEVERRRVEEHEGIAHPEAPHDQPEEAAAAAAGAPTPSATPTPAPSHAPPIDAVVVAPAAARAARPRAPSSTAIAAQKRSRDEEPKRVIAWWCKICNKGGNQLATSCKHEWKQGEIT